MRIKGKEEILTKTSLIALCADYYYYYHHRWFVLEKAGGKGIVLFDLVAKDWVKFSLFVGVQKEFFFLIENNLMWYTKVYTHPNKRNIPYYKYCPKFRISAPFIKRCVES